MCGESRSPSQRSPQAAPEQPHLLQCTAAVSRVPGSEMGNGAPSTQHGGVRSRAPRKTSIERLSLSSEQP